MTDDEQNQFGRAMGSLTEDCMHKAGYGSWSSAPDLPKVGPKTLTDLRYGIHDAVLVGKRGYHPDAAEKAAHDAAVEAAVAGGTRGAAAVAESDCGQKSKQQIGDAQSGFQLAEQLANDAFTKAKQEPEVVAAFAQWSACMKESGYKYREPLDAVDDRKFSRDVTKAEIDTALADLNCRSRSNVALVWYQAEVRLQKDAAERNAQALHTARTRLDATLKNVSVVLAGKR
ncbi:hypothetical protein [Streptomyces sp. CB01881]|uniref:hypothetical protein n=1 Tax=Streptomyces sp. CB01881 TaxID=2078691 RepID=UPI000CDC4C4F|nr:hypothetical protein [Streptomyces sp. CB01881]AUY52487.1 hypothetical protein C2142_30250 [Streptomyces sp. CB01881]TYC71916.1 hypothetical protein EH183_30235 [Streptomyces sp. CB01881]